MNLANLQYKLGIKNKTVQKIFGQKNTDNFWMIMEWWILKKLFLRHPKSCEQSALFFLPLLLELCAKTLEDFRRWAGGIYDTLHLHQSIWHFLKHVYKFANQHNYLKCKMCSDDQIERIFIRRQAGKYIHSHSIIS